VTDIISNTYYARIHLGRVSGAPGAPPTDEVDVDARPSDAINLAVRFGAPMYCSKKIAEAASIPPAEQLGAAAAAAAALAAGAARGGRGLESNAEIVRSVREALSSYDDPTVGRGRGAGGWVAEGQDGPLGREG
jgi:hypothetical protein